MVGLERAGWGDGEDVDEVGEDHTLEADGLSVRSKSEIR